MKKIGLILFALVLSTGFIAAQDGKKAPKVTFQKAVHDFGKVAESAGSVSCEFTFKNTGTAPFLIQRVQASCGCTTPDYTNEPVLPGKEGKIKVTYSTTGRPGTFSKDVTVFSNVPDSIYRLNIKGEVIRK
ncbi:MULTISPECIES: DUF1573 domain-containing protein [Dysgonomonas]|jgi:hypothetical protein|uniref:DUF1573 domain-containing protein n=2 Tax=Dysgonomonas TaxID=156973 RepID=F5J0N6_9BACT|nr:MULTISPECIES: DUF1573 domain-containing protein [Dysgonomonas]EGK00629.1 hypothetical protein HMPREF9455_02903 [Dysgonomonas gadei ATCC BAA-286]MBF0647356.1 DUF1573 domain-containing protein [Dysgonomonas sp. GY75]SBV93501.1 conserved exported hypothetical protein [uncultured Dysgonomonas sp.]